MQDKIKQFINLNINKFVEIVDFNNLYQCVDLAVAWIDYIKAPRATTAFLYAYQIYTDAKPETLKLFERIPNTPQAIPQAGDIVVWGGSYNRGIGHVGIATGRGDANTFECFVQNDPVKSPSIVRTYSYNHVLGWLRYKTPDPLTECLRLHGELVTKCSNLEKKVFELNGALEGEKKKILDKDQQIREIHDDYKSKLANLRAECLIEFRGKVISKLQEIS